MMKFGLSAIVALASISLVDARYQACSRDMYYDLDACQCFQRETCHIRCDQNKEQDPREYCSCTDKTEIEALYDHDGYDAFCHKVTPEVILEVQEDIKKPEAKIIQKSDNKIIEKLEETIENKDDIIEILLDSIRELKQTVEELQEEIHESEEIEPVVEAEEQCTLTRKDCPNKNFLVNEEECECQCDLVCIATMSVDTETCTCRPIEILKPAVIHKPIVVDIQLEIEEPEPEPVEVIQLFETCDADGNKICPVAKCLPGSVWDEQACICAPLKKCRVFCPEGQGLDPREVCSCIDQSEIDALYECEPDQETEETEETEEIEVIEEIEEPEMLDQDIEETEEPEQLLKHPQEQRLPRYEERREVRRPYDDRNPYAQRNAEFDGQRRQERRPYQERPRQNRPYRQEGPPRQDYRQGRNDPRQYQPQYNRPQRQDRY